MRFLIHGPDLPEIPAALKKHEHAAHALTELAADFDSAGGDAAAARPEILLPLLEKKQWNLLTTDSDFIHKVYDAKSAFSGIIVQILHDPAAPQNPADAIDRLFERYPRLTPRRLYTITPSRVKIRQLPGA